MFCPLSNLLVAISSTYLYLFIFYQTPHRGSFLLKVRINLSISVSVKDICKLKSMFSIPSIGMTEFGGELVHLFLHFICRRTRDVLSAQSRPVPSPARATCLLPSSPFHLWWEAPCSICGSSLFTFPSVGGSHHQI